MVYFLMTGLAEMTSFMPVSGAYAAQATKFVDPAFGFAVGWNSWFGWAVTIAVELQAGAILMGFWFPAVPSIVWSASLLAVLLTINLIGAKGYGETEYWLSSIKVGSVIIIIIVGFLMIFGILGGQATGTYNLTVGEAPFVGGISGMFSVFLVAGFAFIGSEMFAITAGEVENAEQNIPKAVKQIIWRLIIFYIVATFVLSTVIPYDNPNLLNSSVDNVAISPFTILLSKSGIPFAAHLMNAIVLVAVLSVTNSGLFLTSRMLFAMANSRKAPKLFAKTNNKGVPVAAILCSAVFGCLCFLSSFVGSGKIYLTLLNMSALNGFLMWLVITICYYRFRRGYIIQGYKLENLTYTAKWFPSGPIFAMCAIGIIVIGQDIVLFTGDTIDWFSVISINLCLVLFVVPYFIYKIKYKTKMIPLDKIDYLNKESVF
uniref:amino acid permease n=1 Tax=Aminipila terrae TaxID=2697030 RepID=UPI001FAD833E|nr:amino acid permease [Aminipila terrae]